MEPSRRIGIIDIGSNSIRLVIYEQKANGAYRVISEFKDSARLSGKVNADGSLPADAISHIIAILRHFREICRAHEVSEFRVAATAAIRNATNSADIIAQLNAESGFTVEVLSGEDEARIGFLGMINTMHVEDGILVDIGGGSTEVTLFRRRELVRSVSFPFGAVNTTRKYSSDGNFSDDDIRGIRHMVELALKDEPWIRQSPGLPLVGLGGTIRTICKINQRKLNYSLPVTHHYAMSDADMDELVKELPPMPADKRKKIDGLSKERFDIIVPGLVILHTVFQAAGCSHYIVSGAGLRDGLYYESFQPGPAKLTDVTGHSSENLLALLSTAPPRHTEQVARTSLQLYDAIELAGLLPIDVRIRQVLHVAAKLYRIGASISYYQYAKHSFHLISQTRVDGFSHRETLLCAFISTYKTKNKLVQQSAAHKDILLKSDVELAARLGMLLQLAIALDASEIQSLSLVNAVCEGKELRLHLQKKYDPSVEYREIAALQKEFKKIWDLQITIHEPSFSTS